MSNQIEVGSRVYIETPFRRGTVEVIHEDGLVDVLINGELIDGEYEMDDLTLLSSEMDQDFDEMLKEASDKINEAAEAMKKFQSSLDDLANIAPKHNKHDVLCYMSDLGLCKDLEIACDEAGWSTSSLYC